MNQQKRRLSTTIAVLVALAPIYLRAADSAMGTDFVVDRDNAPVLTEDYSPLVGDDFPDRVFCGDTHLHSSYSYDAGLVGNTLGPGEDRRPCARHPPQRQPLEWGDVRNGDPVRKSN
jgi:hypothetical protein